MPEPQHPQEASSFAAGPQGAAQPQASPVDPQGPPQGAGAGSAASRAQERTAALPAIPPARIAHTAGEVIVDLDFAWGRSTVGHSHPVIPLPQEVPRRPAQLDQGNATARLAQMVGDLRQWILEFPYELHGELAVIARLFRELEARRVSLKTAGELGRTVAPDVIDEMAYTPGVVSGR